MKTGWRGMAAATYLAMAGLAAMVAAFFLVLSVVPIPIGGGPGEVTLFFGAFSFLGLALSAVVVLAGLALTDFPVSSSPAPPEQTLAYLGARLRYVHPRVQELPGELRVQLGQWAAVRLRARPSGSGSVVTFRADLTPAGLGAILVLLLFVPYAEVFAIPGTVAIFLAARAFALRRVAPLIPGAGPLPEPPKPDEVSVILVSGLAEGHRLAAEAYEAERSSYHDAQALVFLAALVLWAILFVAMFTSLPEGDFGARAATSFWVSLANAVAFGIGVGYLVYRQFRPRLLRYRGDAERLRAAWEREASRAPYPHEGPSAFEILAGASRDVPEWLRVAGRSVLSRDPATGLLFVALVSWSIGLLPGAVVMAVVGAYLLAAILGGIGVLLVFILLTFYRRLRARLDREAREESERWNRRLEDLRARADRYLEGL